MKQRKLKYGPEIEIRQCDKEDCTLGGEYPAPKDPKKLREYNWFCLQHVREYNLGWNYYKGMTQGEVEAHNKSDSTWQRPTWNAQTSVHNTFERITTKQFDNYAFLFDDMAPKPIRGSDESAMFFAKNTPEAKALKTIGLEQPITLVTLKKAYKDMVKLHHPDKNSGCKKSEEKLKVINIAFAIIMGKLKGENNG